MMQRRRLTRFRILDGMMAFEIRYHATSRRLRGNLVTSAPGWVYPFSSRRRAGVLCALVPFFFRLKRRQRWGTYSSSVANLKPACPLALDDDFAMRRAQFDLANVSAGAVNLRGDHGRALQTSASFALRDVAASVDADRCRSGVEVRLKHAFRRRETVAELLLQ
jgi:hypothetical protein